MGTLDTMFAQLVLTDNTWATTIAGFVLLLIILFSAIAIFGTHKVQFSAFAFLVIIFIGMVLATVLGLFPAYVLLLFLVLSLVAIIVNKLFFGGGQ